MAAAALVWEVVDEKPCMLGMRCVVLCRCCEYLCCGKFAMPRVTVTSWKYDYCTDSRISKCKSYAGVTLKKNMICQHNNILAIITKFSKMNDLNYVFLDWCFNPLVSGLKQDVDCHGLAANHWEISLIPFNCLIRLL